MVPPLSGLDQRPLRGGSPGAACFCTIFSGRTCDLKVTPSLQELRCLGFVPCGLECERKWGVGPCPQDEKLKGIPGVLAGTCSQIGGRTALGDSVEENKDPASFLQDVPHLPDLPDGDSGPHSRPLPPRGCSWCPWSELSYTFTEHLPCAWHGVRFLGERPLRSK